MGVMRLIFVAVIDAIVSGIRMQQSHAEDTP